MCSDCSREGRRIWARGRCKSCYNKWLKEQNPGYAQRQQAQSKAWHKRNPDKVRANQRKHDRKRERGPKTGEQLRVSRARQYGLTVEEMDIVLSRGCEICGADGPAALLSIDHDHDTGEVRGCLCRGCNLGLGLGWFEKPGFTDAARAYLRMAQDRLRRSE